MLDSLSIAATGMHAQQMKINSISHNIANINTTAFKSTDVSFTSLIEGKANATDKPSELRGLGVSGLNQTSDLSSGTLVSTGKALDLAISGQGYFELIDELGNLAYTRDGRFKIDDNGYITNMDGLPLSSMIQLRDESIEAVRIDTNGAVMASVSGGGEPINLGNIDLAFFMSPSALENNGRGLYTPNNASGDAFMAPPQEKGSLIQQGYTESSNVDMVNEMTSLVLAQKAYGMSSRLIQASDEILSLINNLRQT